MSYTQHNESAIDKWYQSIGSYTSLHYQSFFENNFSFVIDFFKLLFLNGPNHNYQIQNQQDNIITILNSIKQNVWNYINIQELYYQIDYNVFRKQQFIGNDLFLNYFVDANEMISMSVNLWLNGIINNNQFSDDDVVVFMKKYFFVEMNILSEIQNLFQNNQQDRKIQIINEDQNLLSNFNIILNILSYNNDYLFILEMMYPFSRKIIKNFSSYQMMNIDFSLKEKIKDIFIPITNYIQQYLNTLHWTDDSEQQTRIQNIVSYYVYLSLLVQLNLSHIDFSQIQDGIVNLVHNKTFLCLYNILCCVQEEKWDCYQMSQNDFNVKWEQVNSLFNEIISHVIEGYYYSLVKKGTILSLTSAYYLILKTHNLPISIDLLKKLYQNDVEMNVPINGSNEVDEILLTISSYFFKENIYNQNMKQIQMGDEFNENDICNFIDLVKISWEHMKTKQQVENVNTLIESMIYSESLNEKLVVKFIFATNEYKTKQCLINAFKIHIESLYNQTNINELNVLFQFIIQSCKFAEIEELKNEMDQYLNYYFEQIFQQYNEKYYFNYVKNRIYSNLLKFMKTDDENEMNFRLNRIREVYKNEPVEPLQQTFIDIFNYSKWNSYQIDRIGMIVADFETKFNDEIYEIVLQKRKLLDIQTIWNILLKKNNYFEFHIDVLSEILNDQNIKPMIRYGIRNKFFTLKFIESLQKAICKTDIYNIELFEMIMMLITAYFDFNKSVISKYGNYSTNNIGLPTRLNQRMIEWKIIYERDNDRDLKEWNDFIDNVTIINTNIPSYLVDKQKQFSLFSSSGNETIQPMNELKLKILKMEIDRTLLAFLLLFPPEELPQEFILSEYNNEYLNTFILLNNILLNKQQEYPENANYIEELYQLLVNSTIPSKLTPIIPSKQFEFEDTINKSNRNQNNTINNVNKETNIYGKKQQKKSIKQEPKKEETILDLMNILYVNKYLNENKFDSVIKQLKEMIKNKENFSKLTDKHFIDHAMMFNYFNDLLFNHMTVDKYEDDEFIKEKRNKIASLLNELFNNDNRFIQYFKPSVENLDKLNISSNNESLMKIMRAKPDIKFKTRIRTSVDKRFGTLRNPTNSICYINSAIQTLYHCPDVRDFVLHMDFTIYDPNNGLKELQEIFKQLDKRETVDMAKYMKQVANGFPIGKQWDSHEFLTDLMKRLKTYGNGYCDYFQHSQIEIRKCQRCNDQSIQKSDFCQFLTISPGNSVQKQIDNWCSQSEFRDYMTCDQCGNQGKYVINEYDELKTYLFVYVYRVNYSNVLRKNLTPIEIDERIHLKNNVTMRLISMIKHLGNTTDSGHYVCITQGKDGSWYTLSDSTIKEMDKTGLNDKDLKENVSVLIYGNELEIPPIVSKEDMTTENKFVYKYILQQEKVFKLASKLLKETNENLFYEFGEVGNMFLENEDKPV